MKSVVIKIVDVNNRLQTIYVESTDKAERWLTVNGFYPTSGIHKDLKGRRAGLVDLRMYNSSDVKGMTAAFERCTNPIVRTPSIAAIIVGVDKCLTTKERC